MSGNNLMTSRKFWPIFWTQFWGALNDNVFKNAMVILIAYKAYSILGLNPEQMVALCGGVFILPFFIFSSLAGQLADKFSKSKLVIFTKYLELFVMFLGAAGFYVESIPLMLISLFLMGLQSTIFGPAKYSILPELLQDEELVRGNALVEMGTFLAILIGTIIGGVFISNASGTILVPVTILFVAVTGLFCSKKLPELHPVDSTLKVDYNLWTSTLEIINISRKTKSVFISILGISWFWFFGAVLLSIFPIYVKDVLYGSESVVTLFLAIFSIGVAVGSVICEKCSHKRVELGLVPFGSIGLSLFILHLYFIGRPYTKPEALLSLSEFLHQPHAYKIIFDLACLSVMSGFFIVPLYTFIQIRSDRETRSRVIAANNILNALFMVLASLLLMGLFAMGFDSIDVLLSLFILNTMVSLYIYTVIPEFLWRFVCVIIGRLVYRFKISGEDNIPLEGPAVIICNHISFVDWLIISACVRRPVRFVMHYSFMKVPLLSFFFRGAKVIPIAGAKEDPVIMDQAFDAISATLKDDEMVCIFPEGQITRDGKLCPFRPGVEKILSRNPVPVVPIAIKGMWGSFFSRKNLHLLDKLRSIPERLFTKVELEIQPVWRAEEVTASHLEDQMKKLLDD